MKNNAILQLSKNSSNDYIKYQNKSNKRFNIKQKLFGFCHYVFVIFSVFVLSIILVKNTKEVDQIAKISYELNQTLLHEKNEIIKNEVKLKEMKNELETTEVRLGLKQNSIEQMKNQLNENNTLDVNNLKKKINELNQMYKIAKQKEMEYLIQLKDVNCVINNKEAKCKRLREDIIKKRNELGF